MLAELLLPRQKAFCAERKYHMKKSVKIGIANPEIKIGSPFENAALLAEIAKDAEKDAAEILLFPRLALTGATLGDLYKNNLLLSAAEEALLAYVKATADMPLMSLVSIPVSVGGKICECVIAICGGEIIAVLPMPTEGGVFSELSRGTEELTICGKGYKAVYGGAFEKDSLKFAVFTSAHTPIVSADIALILGAEPETLSLERRLCTRLSELSVESAPIVAYAGAGAGESGTDFVFGGRRIVYTSGKKVISTKAFAGDRLSVLNCELSYEHIEACEIAPREFAFDENGGVSIVPLRSPFVPEDEAERAKACELALEIQARALAKRIVRSYSKKVILGISGGLDSTLALLAAVRAMDILEKPHSDIISVTMPCFGTSKRTRGNAEIISEELGADFRVVDIKAAVSQHFEDIGHAPEDLNVVYENSQARERTQILMDMANAESALVIGTGDLSELALGFATYNGDHMSMFGVNGSIPKTLMRAMVWHLAGVYKNLGHSAVSDALYDIVNTPVSPELLPTAVGGDIAQCTEKIIGPYELHDFFLYYLVRHSLSPKQILKLASESFKGVYTEETIRGWLRIFIRRFFSQQFKRSCMPDGVKVTDVSLSPRGSFSMPSDISAALWQAELD